MIARMDARLAAQLDVVIEDLYHALTLEPGMHPHLELLSKCFAPGGRLFVRGREMRPFTPEEFADEYSDRIARGEFSRFHEEEIGREVSFYGAIAHVWSAYEARFERDGHSASIRGVNSIQLERVGDTWQVVSMVWENETPEHPIVPTARATSSHAS